MAFARVPGEQPNARRRGLGARGERRFRRFVGPHSPDRRALDVAVAGGGWLAVQGGDGGEAYTRDGALELGADGTLQNRRGQIVLGDGGPLTIRPVRKISIGGDGR